MNRILIAAAFSSLVAALAVPAQAQTLTLHGASQFNDDHAFTKALAKFEELPALIEDMNVIPDFRHPDNIRLGVAPLYTTFQEVHEAVRTGVAIGWRKTKAAIRAPHIDAATRAHLEKAWQAAWAACRSSARCVRATRRRRS